MDLPATLPLALSSIAIAVSIITFWLAEFRGPNITLQYSTGFKTSDDTFKKNQDLQIKTYTPRWLELDTVIFLFTNLGGKAGSIVDLKLDFVPNTSFFSFYKRFSARLLAEEIHLPLTIGKGNCQTLSYSVEIETTDWKEIALLKALGPNLKINDIVAKALELSKENFQRFCDFLEHSKELGKVRCTITLTKGRVVKDEVVLEGDPVSNGYDEGISLLRNCLSAWENLSDTKVELRDKLVRDVDDLKRELYDNLSALENSMNESDISQRGAALKLKVDAWNRLQNIRTDPVGKIRWFLIKSDEGLEEDIVKLYNNIMKYNSSYDELLSLGDLRTTESFDRINTEREKLSSDMKKVWDRISRLHKLCT